MLSYRNYSEDTGQSSFIQHLPGTVLGTEGTVKKANRIAVFVSYILRTILEYFKSFIKAKIAKGIV